MAMFCGSCSLEFTAIVVVLCSALVWFVRRNSSYWHRLGIKTPSWSHPILGQVLPFMKLELSLGQLTKKIYKDMKSQGLRIGGCNIPFPVLMPIAPDVVKGIMQKDFDHFVNRGLYYNEKDDPLSAHLFFIEDTKWRTLRAKLTPTFTSGKMRMMFETILATSNRLPQVLDSMPEQDAIEIKDILARLTTDIIGSCAFGLDCNSLNNPDTDFRIYGKRALSIPSVFKGIVDIFAITFPNVGRALRIRTLEPEVSNFFLDVLRKTVSYREENNVSRKDFLQLLIQMKNQGIVDGETESRPTTNETAKVTFNELAAQAFVFFTAGFETSSSTMAYTIYELCLNQEIQEKVRKEIQKVSAKNGDLTYEGIMEMHYLDMVISETLRKYPTLPILNRVCTKDYNIPDTDIILKKGTSVVIPVEGLHHDPEYYPKPDVYDPERFNEENKKSRPAFTYLPFGEGPRVCIGLRFGMLQAKVGLATILSNYQLTLNKDKTNVPLKIDPRSILMAVDGGIYVHINRIKQD